jgi:hypothetical protein
MYAKAASYTGALQTNPIDVSDSATVESATVISKQITTTVSDDWALCTVWPTGGTMSGGAGTTQRVASMYDNNSAISPAGNVTLTVNNDTSSYMGMIITSFKTATAAGSGFFALL